MKPIPKDILTKCVDAARLYPSGTNRPPPKLIIIHDLHLVKHTFSLTRWAGYLPDYSPTQAEMPMAYIVILLDTTIQRCSGHDAGIAAMSISLVADEAGLGNCMLGSIDREKLRPLLNIPDNLDILMLVAFGYPKTKPIINMVKTVTSNTGLMNQGSFVCPNELLTTFSAGTHMNKLKALTNVLLPLFLLIKLRS